MAVSVTSKGQVTIPKRVREALGITPGSKVEFDVAGGGARLKLVKRHASSRVEEGAAILDYKGPRISVDKMRPRLCAPGKEASPQTAGPGATRVALSVLRWKGAADSCP